MTRAQARAELAKLGTIAMDVRVRSGQFESETTIDSSGYHVDAWSEFSATAQVRVSRDVTIAPGGSGDTAEKALDALVESARYLAGRHR
jgi:hypothetical protein